MTFIYNLNNFQRSKSIKYFRYNWLKDNVPLPLHMFRDRVSQSRDNGSLTFTRFSEIDEGKYQCTATNDNGTAVSESITLLQACNFF